MRLSLVALAAAAIAACLVAPAAARVHQKLLPYPINALEPVISAESLDAQ